MPLPLFTGMAATESLHSSPSFQVATDHHVATKPMPILTTSNNNSLHEDPMDTTSPTSASMPPPNNNSSPQSEKGADKKEDEQSSGNQQPLGAAAAANQPTKVVQTAFIHKLYNMLEDPTIQHLICWSKSNESFVMSPSQEFSKVLAQYFKHTNISSFVRQLNMYGFHKISDVFHNGAPDNTLWEFRHGNGSFKRGDLQSLKEIKRRASRHTLIHRESFSTTSKSLAPAQPLPQTAEVAHDPIEHFLNEMNSRLSRTEDTVSYLKGRCQLLSDGLAKSHQWNQELAEVVASIVPDPSSPLHLKIANMQRELSRQTDVLRNGPADNDYSPKSYHASNHLQVQDSNHHAPLSPRQIPSDILAQRRPSHPFDSSPHGPPSLRPAANLPPHLSALSSPRRYGSIGASPFSPNSRGPPTPIPASGLSQATYPQPPQSPPANLSRRHTAADIRSHGWDSSQGPPPPLPSPFGSNYAGPGSSPLRGQANVNEGAALREHFANYEMRPSISKNRTPPPPPPTLPDPQLAAIAGTGPDSGWSISGVTAPPRFGARSGVDSAGPATRRSSVVSNLHGLLNPTGGDNGTDDDSSVEREGKRKRIG